MPCENPDLIVEPGKNLPVIFLISHLIFPKRDWDQNKAHPFPILEDWSFTNHFLYLRIPEVTFVAQSESPPLLLQVSLGFYILFSKQKKEGGKGEGEEEGERRGRGRGKTGIQFVITQAQAWKKAFITKHSNLFIVFVTFDCFQMTPCGDSIISAMKTRIWLKAGKAGTFLSHCPAFIWGGDD